MILNINGVEYPGEDANQYDLTKGFMASARFSVRDALELIKLSRKADPVDIKIKGNGTLLRSHKGVIFKVVESRKVVKHVGKYRIFFEIYTGVKNANR